MSTAPHSLPPQAIELMSHVNGARYLRMQRGLANFGARTDGGVSREALTSVENEARRWLMELVQGAPYSWRVDPAGNLFLRRSGRDDALPPVMTGSHIDTQPVGGWLDGAYGVIAGLETMLALDDAGIQTRYPLEVAMWNNEEGSRFKPGAMGSSAFADPSRLDEYLQSTDAGGTTVEQALQPAFSAMQAAEKVPLKRPVTAYIEAHIEQGPVLEAANHTIGVVTGIQGVRWFEVVVSGSSAHAGTTPFANRQDALLSAAQLVVAIHTCAEQYADERLRVTMGRFEVAAGSVNTVADNVLFTIDLRHPEGAVLERFEADIRRIVESNGCPCVATVERVMDRAPTPFDARLIDIVEAAARHSGEPFQRMGSGAFHDAMYLADLCPTAMVFVPSIGGISHNAAEDTKEEHLVAGVKVLAAALTTLAM